LKKYRSETDAKTAELEKHIALLALPAILNKPKISTTVKLHAILKQKEIETGRASNLDHPEYKTTPV
jgi:hypothetical protein